MIDELKARLDAAKGPDLRELVNKQQALIEQLAKRIEQLEKK
jgi:hypothetical protein